ncbi:hypothetical protein ACIQ9P_01080 [Kitasatospora sp. NPDC094019]|uniref:hypothetical protein n=1 Tax=Kitasatospora sp. NPDC094019 TaxID=3364091 RepID=UPI00381FFBDB
MSAVGGTTPERVRTKGTCAVCGEFPVEGDLLETVDERTELVTGHGCTPVRRRAEQPRRYQGNR